MFKKFLRELVESVDGAIGSVIMGMDGISVEEYCQRPDADIQMIGTELSAVLKEMNRASRAMEDDTLGEAMMITDKLKVIVRKINEEYFWVLALNGNGNLGKGRFKLRVLVPKLANEFE
ncbi:MAG: roadblock/LC7 domain-containing protein [bacterium]|nr:roadblock/LC7 domain-containing protein [bacterium]